MDTGAQVTVLSVKGAQKCNLLDKVDSRFRGVAAGVGAARIVGRVHLATLRFGTHTAVDVSLSVLEQSHGPEVRRSSDALATSFEFGQRNHPVEISRLHSFLSASI